VRHGAARRTSAVSAALAPPGRRLRTVIRAV